MNAHYKLSRADEETGNGAATERSAYRRSRGADPVATAGALTVGLATIAALLYMNPPVVKMEKRDVTVVALLEMPQDPPEQAPPPPEQAAPPPKAAITAPVAAIVIPQPAPMQAPSVATPVALPSPPKAIAASAPVARGPENAGDLSARMIAAKPPRYPLESRRHREQGIVVLSVLLTTDGSIADISVARSSGFPRLDDAALDAVRGWRWSPMMRDGSPVMVRGMVTIPFVLQGSDRGHSNGRRGGGGRHDQERHDDPRHDNERSLNRATQTT